MVVHDGRILEKPQDAAQARRFIAGYAASPASTVGAVVCCDLAAGGRREAVEVRRQPAGCSGGVAAHPVGMLAAGRLSGTWHRQVLVAPHGARKPVQGRLVGITSAYALNPKRSPKR